MEASPHWASREMKVVWKPRRRYGVSTEPRPGCWAVFRRGSFTEAGVLETDGVETLNFQGQGGASDLVEKANALILQFADFGYPAQTAFNLVRGLLELEDGISATLVYGQLPRQAEERSRRCR